MSKYRIIMDGKTYEMEIELIDENGTEQPVIRKEQKEIKSAPKAPAVTAAAPLEQKQAATGTGAVLAPMPGTVIKIEKNKGEPVKSGEVVLILEAMKMENEILAPADGTITAMNCVAGGTVAGGDVLFEVK